MAEASDDDLVAHLIATAMPATEKVTVCARGDLVDRHLALVREFQTVTADDSGRSLAGPENDPRLLALHEQIEAVEGEQESSTVEFTLRSIGPLQWANLLRAHRPRPGLDARLAFNLETFPPAAVAACSVTPKISLEQAVQMYGTDKDDGVLHAAEWDKLFGAAFTLNEQATPHPKLPAAIGTLLRNGRSSTTAAPVEFPEAAS